MKRLPFNLLAGLALLTLMACGDPITAQVYQTGRDLDATLARASTYQKRPTCAPVSATAAPSTTAVAPTSTPCATAASRHAVRIAAEESIRAYDTAEAAAKAGAPSAATDHSAAITAMGKLKNLLTSTGGN